MKIESLLTRLEGIRVSAEDLDDGTIPFQVIDALVDYIGNEKIKEKVDEIPF
jgi:hypothetical protein